MIENRTPVTSLDIKNNEERFPVALTVTTIKSNNGAVIGFLGTIRDISYREQLESEQRRLRLRGARAMWVPMYFIISVIRQSLLRDRRHKGRNSLLELVMNTR